MNDLEKQIDELETRSAESALIAELATDPQARRYNSSLARELSDLAAKLRSQERGRIAPKQGRPAGG